MPRTAASNWAMTSGFSGLPKFRQSVIASGRAPTQATERAASATAIAPPRYGSIAQKKGLTSLFIAMPFFVPLTRMTAASPPGRWTVFDWTMWSYCVQIQDFSATLGEARIRRRQSPKSDGSFSVCQRNGPDGRRRRGPRPVVDGRAVRERRGREVRDDLAVEEEDDAARVGDAADLDGVELPLVEDREDLVEAVAPGDEEHPLLRLRRA